MTREHFCFDFLLVEGKLKSTSLLWMVKERFSSFSISMSSK